MDEFDLSKEIDPSREIDLSKAAFLGEGSFCDVHLVEIGDRKRKIAVRTLTSRWITQYFDQKYDFLPDFKEECNILVKLVHPNIIKTFGGSEKVLKDRRPEFGILTEWCERGTLRELIFNPNFLYSMQNVTIWSENLFDALDYMFKRKHIHRNIKTENIFVTKEFIMKLGDFGTTRKIATKNTENTGTFDVGTPRFLSPPQHDLNKTTEELLDQGRKDSSRNDVYALGLVIWQLIERRLVFAEYGTEGEFDQSRFILDVVLGKLKGLDPPKCIQEIREIVKSCCDFDRSKRPYSEEILKRLQEFNKIHNIDDFNDGYPKIDENQQELIRPIGFDQLENRELILVTSSNSNSFGFGSEPSEKHAEMLMEKYSSSETIHLRKEFIKRFNETWIKHEKMDFISETEDIIEDTEENRELIPVTCNNSIPIEIGSEPIEENPYSLMSKHGVSEADVLPNEFIKRFNETSNHEKMDFISETKDIIVDAIDGNYKYFHEYFHRLEDELSYLEAQLLKEEIPEKRRRLEKLKEPLDKMNIKEIFKEVVVRRQNQDMHVLQSGLICYGENSVKMSEATKFSACLLFFEMKHLDMIIKSVKNEIPFSNLKFKCFLSSQGEEWILIGESFFSSKSFDKFLQLPKERCFENGSVSHPIGDGLHHFDDFIIRKSEFVQILERRKLKHLTIFKLNYCLSSCQTSKRAQEIEKDFPIEIKGRPLFQLSNPPGIHCSHEPKCEIKIEGTELYKNSDEGGSDERLLDIPDFYDDDLSQEGFSNWTKILDLFYWDIPKSKIQPNSDRIVLLQVIDSNCILTKYLTLLDFSDEYFNGPHVPYLNRNHYLDFTDGSFLHHQFIHTPKNKRRYLVATPIKRGDWNLSVFDYQGKARELDSNFISDSGSGNLIRNPDLI